PDTAQLSRSDPHPARTRRLRRRSLAEPLAGQAGQRPSRTAERVAAALTSGLAAAPGGGGGRLRSTLRAGGAQPRLPAQRALGGRNAPEGSRCIAGWRAQSRPPLLPTGDKRLIAAADACAALPEHSRGQQR